MHKRQVQNFLWQVLVVRMVDVPRQIYSMTCNASHENKVVIYFCLYVAFLEGKMLAFLKEANYSLTSIISTIVL